MSRSKRGMIYSQQLPKAQGTCYNVLFFFSSKKKRHHSQIRFRLNRTFTLILWLPVKVSWTTPFARGFPQFHSHSLCAFLFRIEWVGKVPCPCFWSCDKKAIRTNAKQRCKIYDTRVNEEGKKCRGLSKIDQRGKERY